MSQWVNNIGSADDGLHNDVTSWFYWWALHLSQYQCIPQCRSLRRHTTASQYSRQCKAQVYCDALTICIRLTAPPSKVSAPLDPLTQAMAGLLTPCCMCRSCCARSSAKQPTAIGWLLCRCWNANSGDTGGLVDGSWLKVEWAKIDALTMTPNSYSSSNAAAPGGWGLVPWYLS